MQPVTKLTQFAGKLPNRERGMYLIRIGLLPEYPCDSCTLVEVATVYDLAREGMRRVYVKSVGIIADKVEKWAKKGDYLPDGFRNGLMNPSKD